MVLYQVLPSIYTDLKMPNFSLTNRIVSRSMLVGNPYYIPSSFESIATVVGDDASTTLTFSSIPSTYKHLQIRFACLGDGISFRLRINGSTDANLYAYHLLRGNGATVAASGTTTGNNSYMPIVGDVVGGLVNYPFVSIIDIHDYQNTSNYKTVRMLSGTNTNTAGTEEIQLKSGLFLSTSAISSLTFTTNGAVFASSSKIALYGIKGA